MSTGGLDLGGLNDNGGGNAHDFVHGVVGRRGYRNCRDRLQRDSASLADFCLFLIIASIVDGGDGARMLAALAPTPDQRTQSKQTSSSGPRAHFGNSEDSNRVSHYPEPSSSAAKSVKEAKARYGHDAAYTSQDQDKAGGNLGLVVQLHSSKGKDGQDGESPACNGVDDAVGVLHTLHSFPRHTHGVVVSSIKVHGVTAAEKHDEKEGKTKGGIDADNGLDSQALPFFEQDAVEGYGEGGLEEYVCQNVEGELEDLVLVVVSIRFYCSRIKSISLSRISWPFGHP